jgi:hypothetical protein
MKINFSHELKTLDGKSIPGFDGKERTSLKDVCVDALLAQFRDEVGAAGNPGTGISGEEKCNRYVLATRIYGDDEVDLKVEEIALLKKLVGKGFGPLIVGQAWDMLENKQE